MVCNLLAGIVFIFFSGLGFWGDGGDGGGVVCFAEVFF